MVSTRQMSIVNGAIVDCANQNAEYSPARTTRNSMMDQSYLYSQPGPSNATYGPSYRITRHSTTTTSTIQSNVLEPPKNLMDLPQEVLENILSNVSFKDICQLRLVSNRFDAICGQILNKTFLRLLSKMHLRFQDIKSKMPRRESARRNHHLACECDIIETLHMRLTLLQMSFGKHIERKHLCFFPGEILDEVYNILNYINNTPKLSRPYKVTDELFDLSTMAMEYFKEKIEPHLPEITYFQSDFLDFGTSNNSYSTNKFLALDSSPLGPEEVKEIDRPNCNLDTEEPLPQQTNMVLRKRIKKIKQGMRKYNSQLSLLKQDLKTCKRKVAEQQKQITEQQKQITEQQKQTLEYVTRLDECDKKNEEISRKFGTLLQELNKCKTELQYWRAKSPSTPYVCNSCGNVMNVPTDELEVVSNDFTLECEATTSTAEKCVPEEVLQPQELEVNHDDSDNKATPSSSRHQKRKRNDVKEVQNPSLKIRSKRIKL